MTATRDPHDGPAGGPVPGPPGLAYLPALDGLRGTAVLLVVVGHYSAVLDGASPACLAYRHVAVGGWVGVDLFFVLSGFLITRILLRERGRPGYFRSFYARRTLRIVPLYYGVLAVACFVLPAVTGRPVDRVGDGHWSLWPYLSNCWVAFHGRPVPPVGDLRVNHFWSLAVEEHFYLAWPAVVLLFSPRRLWWACGGAVAVALATRLIGTAVMGQVDFAYTFTPCRIDGLAIGAALALAAQTDHGRRMAVRVARPAGVVAAVCIAALFVRHHDLGIEGHRRTFLASLSLTPVLFGGLVAVAAFAPAGRVATAARCRPLVWLGRYSYGIYVYHALLLFPFVRWFYNPLAVRPGCPPLVATLAFTAAAGAASVGIAVVSYHLYELPFLRLKKRFAYG